jgi:hypothetical protein
VALALGAVFRAIGAVWDLAFAGASGTIGAWLQRRPRIRAAQPCLEGLAYLRLAGWAAASRAAASRAAAGWAVARRLGSLPLAERQQRLGTEPVTIPTWF